MRFKGFVGPSYTMRGSIMDAQRCVNLYPEVDEARTGKNGEVACFYGSPGLKKLAEVGYGPIRGNFFASNNILYIVSGKYLYRVASDWTSTNIGAIGGSSRVQMCDNGTQLFLSDGTAGYLHVLGTNTTTALSAFDGGGSAIYQDTYFISLAPGTPKFYISDNLDGNSWNALDFGSADSNPDNLVAQLSNNAELWNFGERTTEVWYNSGNADFPFDRIQSALIAYGCAAKHSPAKIQNTVLWLARNDNGTGTVYAATGFQPQRVSTHAVEYAIQGYETIEDATSYVYEEEGHVFYCLNFPTAEVTWCYDSATALWHERASLRNGMMGRWTVENHSNAYGIHVVGDHANANIYQQSLNILDEAGLPIKRIRSAPHIQDGMVRIFYKRLQLDLQTGVGINGSGQGVDPQVALEWSNDGGLTWTPERWVSAGKMGDFKCRSIWRMLGSARDRVFRVSMTDPVRWVIVGAELDLVQGSA